ncbi:MAG: hypothetical protein PHC83_03880 [Bacteroidales bacterium]|nr:hypothetical protein [Bacteroidales bacterium]MDD3280691.1 hypothetical protein [Bacteroidales bacterium]
MRKLIYLIVLVFIITACEPPYHPKPDYITFYKINHTIGVSESYTLDNGMIFKIDMNEYNEVSASILKQKYSSYGDGYTKVLVNYNNQIFMLNEDYSITSSNHWGSSAKISLEQFAGKGEKYIGYRHQSPPLGNDYYYGWIKISLSADKKTLHIISNAINYTENNPILAGQMK